MGTENGKLKMTYSRLRQILINTGPRKGMTTAAIGTALREVKHAYQKASRPSAA